METIAHMRRTGWLSSPTEDFAVAGWSPPPTKAAGTHPPAIRGRPDRQSAGKQTQNMAVAGRSGELRSPPTQTTVNTLPPATPSVGPAARWHPVPPVGEEAGCRKRVAGSWHGGLVFDYGFPLNSHLCSSHLLRWALYQKLRVPMQTSHCRFLTWWCFWSTPGQISHTGNRQLTAFTSNR